MTRTSWFTPKASTDQHAGPKRQRSRGVGSRAAISRIVLAELFHVLTRKGRLAHAAARDAVLEWARVIPVLPHRESWLITALDLAGNHRLAIWDAAILDAAADAGCEFLLSEDMPHGFRWRGVTVVNPFLRPRPQSLNNLFTAL